MGKKFYAVKKGVIPGVYETWKECQSNVTGVSGAIYKSFLTREEAEEFIKSNKKIEQKSDNVKKEYSKFDVIAYVDGSYDSKIDVYGYGAVIFYNGEKHVIKGNGKESELKRFRNVAGEVIAATKAIEYALENKVNNIFIYYDYLGIEKWFTGEWKSNTTLTREYNEFANKVKGNINVNFIKVKAHSGDMYNDEVDLIAKSAVYEDKEIFNEKDNQIVDEIKECKISNGKIEPVFNIIKDKKRIDTNLIINEFKNKWKHENRKLKEIDSLKIEIDLDNNQTIFYIYVNKEIIIRKIDNNM